MTRERTSGNEEKTEVETERLGFRLMAGVGADYIMEKSPKGKMTRRRIEAGSIRYVDDISELGPAKDKYEPLNAASASGRGGVVPLVGLRPVPDEAEGWWNVQNTATGDFINEEPLSEEDALALMSEFDFSKMSG